MGESAQDQYAKNLPQPFGYPLRIPEPKSGLPSSYEEQGLQIGDVGYVDDDGMFEVLFNICFPSHHDLHQDRPLLSEFVGLTKFNINETSSIPNAFPSGRVICHGIQGSHGDNLNHTQSAACKFVSCSTSGAILVLPSGAVRKNLNKSKEEEFRELAGKWALDWCRFANCKSLYLVTGFYKTSSWYLASFRGARSTEETILERDAAGRYSWSSKCDYRKSLGENRHENQTVLISGFKIEIRGWDEHIVIEKLTPHSRSVWLDLTLLANSMLSILVILWRWMVSSYMSKFRKHGTQRAIVDRSVQINRVPAFSQPFHPSDVINRYLLDKNPNVQVAVTHDSQWQSMLEKNELSCEDMTEEGRFRTFLEENYTDGSYSDNVVYLRRKIETSSKDHSVPHKSAFSPTTFSIPAPHDIRHVITHMRAENVVACLGRMPAGFDVLVQFDGLRRRSRTKTASLRASTIEWEDVIVMPMDPSVRVQLSINASFEYEPVLGNGESLYSSEINIHDLVQAGSTYLLLSSDSGKDTHSCLSLLLTVEERCHYFVDPDHGDRRFEHDDHSYLSVVEATDKGHEALLHYHRDHEIAKLSGSIEQFTLALDLCPPNHKYRAAALLNLATARFIQCQVNGTPSELSVVIEYHREALELRPAPHPDRPGTQINLTRALLYCYGRVCSESSVAEEIQKLVAEVQHVCPEGSYEHRAANLVRQTLKRYQILTPERLVEPDGLVSEFQQSVGLPADWYLDKPYRLINLSATLRKRFDLGGDLGALENSISAIEEAAQLIPDGHFEKPWILASLGDALCVRGVCCGIADMDNSVSMIEDAMKLTPDGHFEKPWMATRLGAALLVRFICHNIFCLNITIFVTGSTVHLSPRVWLNQPTNFGSTSIWSGSSYVSDGDLKRAILELRNTAERLHDDNIYKSSCLANLATSLLINFWCLGDISDLEEAVLLYKDAIKLIPHTHPDKPDYLNNLALALRTRYELFPNLIDLGEAISCHRSAVDLVSDGHPNKPSHLTNLGNCFAPLFEHCHRLSDLEDAIASYKSAIGLTPDYHPAKPTRLHTLASFLNVRFQCLGEMDDITGAILNLVDAIKLTPHRHPDRAIYQQRLSSALEVRFQCLTRLMEQGFLRAVSCADNTTQQSLPYPQPEPVIPPPPILSSEPFRAAPDSGRIRFTEFYRPPDPPISRYPTFDEPVPSSAAPEPSADMWDTSPYRHVLANVPAELSDLDDVQYTGPVLVSDSEPLPLPSSRFWSLFGPKDKGKKLLRGLVRSNSTSAQADLDVGPSSGSHLRSHTMTSILIPPPAASVPAMDMPVPTAGPPIKFDHTGEYAGFVNHSPHRVMYKNKMYPTALHLLEAMKFVHQPALQERIRTCRDVTDMYPLSASLQEHVHPDWGQVFLKVMEDVLYLKFKQHSGLRTLLMQTGISDIIYADENVYWGDGHMGDGRNELGKALVRLRERLRQESGI